MSDLKNVDIWEAPHVCRARDGGPVGARFEPCGDGEQEVLYPCASPGVCPHRSFERRPLTVVGQGMRS